MTVLQSPPAAPVVTHIAKVARSLVRALELAIR